MPIFEKIWSDLRRTLLPRQVITGWSRDKGETALKFRIAEVESTSITVMSGQGKRRRISKGDFAQVFAFWSEYCRGEITRHAMAQVSQNTSYIFGILRWLETRES